jgi:hypothetical protein
MERSAISPGTHQYPFPSWTRVREKKNSDRSNAL